MTKLLQEFEFAKSITTETVELLRKNNFLNSDSFISSNKDIKTEADKKAHDYIINRLSDTGIPIISEEQKNLDFNINNKQWIIDPIDGTFNYVKGFEMASVSIALWDKGFPLLGIVQNIFNKKLYSACFECGAWEDDRRIKVSNQKKINEASLATGFPSGRNYDYSSLNNFIKDIQMYKKIRMLGSASVMLNYVACGIFDIYYEEDIYIWDIAAGLAIISEAGGKYILQTGSSNLKYNIRASNPYLI